ncbi:MAG: VOC family protein [Chlamydiia bacterium]|nr:VOC family protein [Chlamydiia bacterium]
MTQNKPKEYHSITPMLTFLDTAKAMEFYKKALGAKEKFVLPGPGGKGILHAEIIIGDSIIMMGDEYPEKGYKSAETIGDSPIKLYLYVDNVDQSIEHALSCGAKPGRAPEDMFWGDRIGSFMDPFGYLWTLASQVKALSPEEMEKNSKAFLNAEY